MELNPRVDSTLLRAALENYNRLFAISSIYDQLRLEIPKTKETYVLSPIDRTSREIPNNTIRLTGSEAKILHDLLESVLLGKVT